MTDFTYDLLGFLQPRDRCLVLVAGEWVPAVVMKLPSLSGTHVTFATERGSTVRVKRTATTDVRRLP